MEDKYNLNHTSILVNLPLLHKKWHFLGIILKLKRLTQNHSYWFYRGNVLL